MVVGGEEYQPDRQCFRGDVATIDSVNTFKLTERTGKEEPSSMLQTLKIPSVALIGE